MQGAIDDQLLARASSQTRNNPGVVVVVVLDRIDPSREDISSSPSVDICTATLLVSPWLLDGHHTSALLWQFHPRLEESFSFMQTYTTLPERMNLGISANNGTLRPSTSMDRWMILHDIALVIVPYFIILYGIELCIRPV